MDALGRGLAVMLSVIVLTFLSVFYKTAPVAMQRNETVRSICHAYAEQILNNKQVTQEGWRAFCEQINRIGTYRAELKVYEKRTFKGESGDVSLFTERTDMKEDAALWTGCYVRLTVTEEPKTKAEFFFHGASCRVYAGGRIE